MSLTPSLERLIAELSKLPTVGPKTAQKLAFYLLKVPKEEIERLIDAILKTKEKVRYCSLCYNVTEEDLCSICQNSQRDSSVICVVEDVFDVVAFEKTGGYRGLYHVLGGAISPLDGICPEDLKIKELLSRVKEKETREVIIATNLNIEGETTAIYLANLLKPIGIKVTRVACGIPVGTELEYADTMTLDKALQGRTVL